MRSPLKADRHGAGWAMRQVLQRVRWREEFRPVAPSDPAAVRLLLLLDIVSAQGFPSRNVAVRWQLNWNPDLWHVEADGLAHSSHFGQLQVSFRGWSSASCTWICNDSQTGASPQASCEISSERDLWLPD